MTDMNELDELQQEIEALMKSVMLGRFEALTLQLDATARARVRRHIEWCIAELKERLDRLDALSKPN